jgi:chromosome segregation ATPase
MSGEITQDFNGGRSFEERVFARFDGIESFLRSLDGRVQVLESRSHDTKPIWERALNEILETRSEVSGLKNNVSGLKNDVSGLKNDVSGLKSDVSGLKGDMAGLKVEVRETKHELREFKHEVNKRLDRILSMAHENRADIRDAEERIEKLETKVGLEPNHS